MTEKKHQDTEAKNLPEEIPPKREENRALAVVDYGDQAGAGAEGMSQDDYKIPLLRILQTNSPQVDGEKKIEGAVAGMIFNTATQEFWDVTKQKLIFVPSQRDRNFVEYIPREPWGGGFVGTRKPDDPLVLKLLKEQGKFGKLKYAEGTTLATTGQQVPTEISDTFYLYGIVVTPYGVPQRAVIPFTSTQIPKYQAWAAVYDNTRYPGKNRSLILPPVWCHRYALGTRAESNKKGRFYGWTLGFEKSPSIESRIDAREGHPEFDPLAKMASEFYDMIKRGAAKIDRDAEQAAGVEKDEEVPF